MGTRRRRSRRGRNRTGRRRRRICSSHTGANSELRISSVASSANSGCAPLRCAPTHRPSLNRELTRTNGSVPRATVFYERSLSSPAGRRNGERQHRCAPPRRCRGEAGSCTCYSRRCARASLKIVSNEPKGSGCRRTIRITCTDRFAYERFFFLFKLYIPSGLKKQKQKFNLFICYPNYPYPNYLFIL